MSCLITTSAVVAILALTASCAAEQKMEMKQIGGQAEFGTVEIHGVCASDFRPELWKTAKLNIVPDIRQPLIEPRKSGVFRNIYAPSVVETEDGWRLFYGAWDGVDSGNDRIYSVTTRDFIDFTDRRIEIEHGEFIHCCNVSALRLPEGGWRLMCTCYPDKDDLNKPGTFTSPGGIRWNGSSAPYAAKQSDIITINGYDKYASADINGMNVIFYEDGVYRLYFNNFKDFGRVYRATSKDGKTFQFDGPAVEFGACANDVKKFTSGKDKWYLMGLHMNGDKLWYSLSTDSMKFDPPVQLVTNLGEKDRYIVAIGWVTKGNRMLGFIYGAGAVPSLDRNRLWGRWLQKKVVFVASDGKRYEPIGALGPDRQILPAPLDKALEGHFTVYDDDGTTVLYDSLPAKLMSGAVYVLSAP